MDSRESSFTFEREGDTDGFGGVMGSDTGSNFGDKGGKGKSNKGKGKGNGKDKENEIKEVKAKTTDQLAKQADAVEIIRTSFLQPGARALGGS